MIYKHITGNNKSLFQITYNTLSIKVNNVAYKLGHTGTLAFMHVQEWILHIIKLDKYDQLLSKLDSAACIVMPTMLWTEGR